MILLKNVGHYVAQIEVVMTVLKIKQDIQWRHRMSRNRGISIDGEEKTTWNSMRQAARIKRGKDWDQWLDGGWD